MTESIESVVRAHITDGGPEFRHLEGLADDESLIDAGILDSVAVFNLVAFLEDRFGIEISDDELSGESWQSLRDIATWVDARLAAVAT